MTTFGVEDVTIEGRLHGITLDVPAGEITAVVGGDGAGKSTLMKLLVWALRPDSGWVRTPEPRQIGFVPTGSGYYPDLTVAENLKFTATAYGLGSEQFEDRRGFVLALTGLEPFTDRLAANLSGGMRQKLALALGTLHDPELLVLDEPTTGVDPVSRVDLWRIIANAAASGVHAIVATSYLDEAERASNVLALHHGRTLLEGAPSQLAASTPGVVLEVAAPSDRDLAWRRGDRWRQWLPDATHPDVAGAVVASLEDAVIVAALQREATRT